jgi:signal-transduction protein with cAMP-binding, CBS, and nucleotidyltransferase domain
MQASLASIARRPVYAVGPHAPLGEVLQEMHRQRVGSVVVADEAMRPLGILTRHDLLERVVLPSPTLDLACTAVSQVMSSPARTLDLQARVHEAALLMARHGLRHVPLTSQGRLEGIVSERDLFALQRQSLGSISAMLRAASAPDELPALAGDIRAFARQLLAQELAAPALAELVTHLNDELASRLYTLLAAAHGLDPQRACWVAFGSEGRGEQTVATDQDNGLVLDDEVGDDELETARQGLIETFPRQFESKPRMLRVFVDDEWTKRPDDYWKTFRKRVAAVTFDDICWIESLQNYTRVCLRNPGRLHIFRRRLREWEVDIPAGVFTRLGRSILVRTESIEETEWTSRNEKVLKFGPGIEPLVIGRLAALRLRDILDGEGEEAP